ncbi:MAG TPA: hypothetical protein VL401_01980 [Alphaproteobacteria bacterium]|jgi:hypothetical protein|nr:hypothetical protein [Alphaproteobacteria bacterium]
MFKKLFYTLVVASGIFGAIVIVGSIWPTIPKATPTPTIDIVMKEVHDAATASAATALAIPTPLAGKMPPMLSFPEDTACKEFGYDKITDYWFCANWQPIGKLSRSYKIEGLEYLVVVKDGNILIIGPAQQATIIPDKSSQGVYLYNGDRSHVAGPIYFIKKNGEIYIDETFKDVVREAPKNQ